jgi:hypothetical protein
MIDKRALLVSALILMGLLSGCETQDVPSRSEVIMSVSPSVISEDIDTGKVIFTLDSPNDLAVNVLVSFSGNATYGVDYTASTEVSIPSGSTTGMISVYSIQDSDLEDNEEIVVQVEDVENGTIIGISSATMIIEDDEAVSGPNLILNEVLYDPSNNLLDGDANGDGTYVHAEDEFIELINLSASPADISGYKVFDAENLALNQPNHTFPAGTIIPPGKALVLFGGGTPTGTFGNAIIQTSTSGDLNLSNAGDFITIMDAAGDTIITFDIEPLSNNPNEAYTRNPDLTGDFEQHAGVNGLLFSPGTKTDGSPF